VNLGVRCQSPCHAPSVRGAIVLLIYVVLDCGQFTFVAKCLRCAPYAYGRILFAVTRRVPLVFL
jgi:hypothetical protein